MGGQGRIGRSWAIALAGLVVLATAGTAAAQAFATLEAVGGDVVVIRQGQSQAVARGMALEHGDIVVTKRGRASLRFQSDGTVLRVGPDSRVQVDESATGRDITTFFGRLWAHVVRWKEQPTRFNTSGTIAAVRGTELSFAVSTDGEKTDLAVLEGKVHAENAAGSLELVGGQSATARKGAAPVRAVAVRPKDAVQWALYYPPVLSLKPGETVPAEGAEVRDARLLTLRAAQLLATGNVDEAARDLEAAEKIASGNSDTLALQSIVAVARTENDRALSLARRAASADPKSAAAQIALSYAQQAAFDLQSAKASVEKAVDLGPTDALAWARLAEIRSSLGDLGGALEAARKAAELAPSLSRTQSVLGYAYLTQVHTTEAKAAFTKAIELDGSDPLPRLGLGLAEIRDGQLADGSKEIEVAVSLDPGQSILRSYLGKAYFEQKREDLVGREYELGKQADPNDPTPYLYDAISKQTTNRPVEALEDVQKAIELNDNRAVYRSRLLLDSDLAARSASLGRIYNDLGFQELGLVEGWTSVNTDPSNFSAHRLLADNYAALPRHEIARVSELFQSQMLQPLNTTPIQPSLGESNLFLISSQGPSTLSFNEFNPLFNRNQANVQGGFMAAEDSTWAGDGIVSGIYDKFSFSGGYSGYKTDGFRENNNQDDKIANAFAQVELSPSTSIQGEVRHRKLETGDLGMHFYEDDFSKFLKETDKITTVRAGLRQAFGPALVLLASYMHSDKDIDFSAPDPNVGQSFTLGRKEKADSVEGQVLFRSARVKVVGGGGYFDINTDESTTFTIEDPMFGFSSINTKDAETKHTNLYAYAYLTLPENLTVTLGASGDFFSEKGTAFADFEIPGLPPGEPIPVEPAPVLGDRNKFNPKAGVSWSLRSGTTLRGAWFRTLKRTLITNQTLEPTQVSGFNQFFDDQSAAESEVWGAALDQKVGGKAFGGVEYSERDLTIPALLLEDGITWTVIEKPGDDRLSRVYLFGAVHPWFTLGAEYQYEKLGRDPGLFYSFSTVKTHRVPLSLRFFHPSGFSAFFAATYLKQEGEFRLSSGTEYLPGDRSFWVVDAGLRFRLPKRYGFVVAGVNNLTDETSTYEATDPTNLSIRPGRVVYGRVVVAFP